MWNDINEKTPPNDQSNKAQAKAKQKKKNQTNENWKPHKKINTNKNQPNKT